MSRARTWCRHPLRLLMRIYRKLRNVGRARGTQMSTPNTARVVAWSRLAHIGAHDGSSDQRPQLDELDLDIVRRACERAWIYSRAEFEPYLGVPLAKSQWRETCALAGSTAESLMLSSATYIETVWHSRLLDGGTEPAGMAMAQRYLAEAAIDTAVSVGHRLINFVVRVARTVPSTSEALGLTKGLDKLGPSYEPFTTEHPKAWLSLNAPEIQKLRDVLPPVHHAALDILDALVASPEWKALFDIRAENFHRWRKEHESVIGVDAQSGHERDILDYNGNVTGRSGGGQSRRHIAGDGLTEKTTAVAGAGIRVVAETLDSIIEDALKVLPTITDGYTVEWDGKRLKQSRQIVGRQAATPGEP